jgi:hypothetical protein
MSNIAEESQCSESYSKHCTYRFSQRPIPVGKDLKEYFT